MRDAIRDRLIQMVTEFQGRVFETFMAGPEVEKPYAVIVIGGESRTNMRYGFDVPVQVWPYVDVTSFKSVDGLVAKIVDALVNVDLETSDGMVFRLRYVGSGDDFYDNEWQALTRRLDFETEVIRGG